MSATTSSYRPLKIVLLVLVLLAIVFIVIGVLKPTQTSLTHAQALIKAGDDVAALPILEELSFKHPDNPVVFPWLARAYLAVDRVAEGRIALDTALKMGLPANDVVPAVQAYAAYYERKADFEEAQKLLQSASFIYPTPVLRENLARLYCTWADDALHNNQISQAIAKYEQANQLKSDLSQPLQTLIVHSLSESLRRWAVIVANKDDNEAIAILEKALQVSDEPATHMILADIYARLGNSQKAIANYQLVVEEDKNNLEARHRLIDLFIATLDYDRAQKALVELTDQEKSIENYQQLAHLDLQLKNYAGAVHALEDACDLGHKPEVLRQLLSVLNDWGAALIKEKKQQEAISVQGHADRVTELLTEITKAEHDAAAQANLAQGEKMSPIALVASHIWLAAGSVTPEGEIKIKNITDKPLADLTLSAVFYDNTAKRANGSVTLPVVVAKSSPIAANDERTLYFSCPNIVKTDHQLAVLLFWKGCFLKELPVTKDYRR